MDGIKLALATSLASMVRAVAWPMDSGSATQLLQAVQASSFDGGQKKLIADSIQGKLLGSTTSTGLGPQDKQCWVTDTAVLKYFTARDWVVLADSHLPFNSDVKTAVIVSRLGRAGFVKPSPPACADCVTMLAAATWNHHRPTCKEFYDLVQALPKCFKKVPTPALDLPVIREWSDSPRELPEEAYKALYPDETDPPVAMALDNFNYVRDEVSCRSSNKKVRDAIKQAPTLQLQQPQQSTVMGNGSGVPFSLIQFIGAAQSMGLTPGQAMQLGMAGAGVGFDGQASYAPDAHGKVPFGSWQPQAGHLMLENGAQPGNQRSAMPRSSVSAALQGMRSSHAPEPLAEREPEPGPAYVPPLPSSGDFATALASEAPSKRTAGATEEEAKATIEAMQKEHAAILAKARKKEGTDGDGAEDTRGAPDDDTPKRKTGVPTHSRPSAMKRPAAALASTPKMPTSGSVSYKGGKVLPSSSKGGWRAWPDASNVGREKVVPFGVSKPSSFRQALKMIHDSGKKR